MTFFEDRDPFSDDTTLHNITTGVVAGKTVNVDDSLSFGIAILKDGW